MFDIGFWELVILFGLGLLVLGPERLPAVAAKLGRWAGQARSMARNLTDQFRDELEPIQSSMDNVNKAMNQSVEENLTTDWSARRPEPGQSSSDDNEDASASDETVNTDWSARRPEPGQTADDDSDNTTADNKNS